MTRRAIWLPLGLFAAALVGLTGFFATDAHAGGGSATVTAGSLTCTPGQTTCTVDLTVTPSGTLVGALDVDINYDSAVLTATAASAPTCNAAFDADTIRCSLANLSGMSGVVSTLTFTAIGADGTSSVLAVVISACTDETGTDVTPCTGVDGLINIQAPTPTPAPTPSPVPTATPSPTPVGQTPSPTPVTGVATATPTPAALPSTGATEPLDGSGSNALPLFLAAMGLAALTAGGWAVTRLRRNQA